MALADQQAYAGTPSFPSTADVSAGVDVILLPVDPKKVTADSNGGGESPANPAPRKLRNDVLGLRGGIFGDFVGAVRRTLKSLHVDGVGGVISALGAGKIEASDEIKANNSLVGNGGTGTNRPGVVGVGDGTGAGINALGGATDAPGVSAVGGGMAGTGVLATAAANGLAFESVGSSQFGGVLQIMQTSTGVSTPTPAAALAGGGVYDKFGGCFAGGTIIAAGALARGKNIQSVSLVATGHYQILCREGLLDDANAVILVTAQTAGITAAAVGSTSAAKLLIDVWLTDAAGAAANSGFGFVVHGE